MKVLLLQIDGKMPNLALMKISAYHKLRGNEVGFDVINPDEIYMSCVFSKNVNQTIGRRALLKSQYPNAKIDMGGPGFGMPTSLPNEVEHTMPDYSLYPEMDYSLGFTTRGCIRNCPFCIVPIIEGKFREHAPISEFHNSDFDKLVLLDNNFLASKLWREKLDYIENQGLKVCFNQGLDARLINEEKARALADTNSYGISFKDKRYYFAWDIIGDARGILRGIAEILKAGVPPKYVMVYVLVGFNSAHYEDYFRFIILRGLKVDPFIMIYNDRRDDKWLRHFARFCNKPAIRKSCKDVFSEYKRLSPKLKEETEGIERRLDLYPSLSTEKGVKR